MAAGTTPLSVGRDSCGPSFQVGADIAISEKCVANLDPKKIYIKTDVSVQGGADLGTLRINPLVFGVGIGTKF